MFAWLNVIWINGNGLIHAAHVSAWGLVNVIILQWAYPAQSKVHEGRRNNVPEELYAALSRGVFASKINMVDVPRT